MFRSLKLVLYLVIGGIVAALPFIGYQIFSEMQTPISAGQTQINPTFDSAADALDSSDLLYRAIHWGHGAYGVSDNAAVIPSLLSRYMKRQDVLVRGQSIVEQRSSSWSLFGGPSPAFWKERTQWCVRIKYRDDGNPSFFVNTLLNLRELKGAPALPEHNPQSPQELQDMLGQYADGIVLAVEFERSGESKSKIDSRIWRLVPDSAICSSKP